MIGANLSSWFNRCGRPIELGNSEVVFGGTHLLAEFLETAAQLAGRRHVSLVAPFIDSNLVRSSPFFSFEATTNTDLLLITSPEAENGDAVRVVTSLPWRSIEVRLLRNLHSKLYVATPESEQGFALTGSHNLTCAAAGRNYEIGVLVCERSASSRMIIADLRDHIDTMRRKSRCIYDSLSYFTQTAA